MIDFDSINRNVDTCPRVWCFFTKYVGFCEKGKDIKGDLVFKNEREDRMLVLNIMMQGIDGLFYDYETETWIPCYSYCPFDDNEEGNFNPLENHYAPIRGESIPFSLVFVDNYLEEGYSKGEEKFNCVSKLLNDYYSTEQDIKNVVSYIKNIFLRDCPYVIK